MCWLCPATDRMSPVLLCVRSACVSMDSGDTGVVLLLSLATVLLASWFAVLTARHYEVYGLKLVAALGLVWAAATAAVMYASYRAVDGFSVYW